MTKVRVILKTGAEFVVECEKFTVKKYPFSDDILSYQVEGAMNNRPLYIATDQIAAIVEEIEI